MKVTVVIPESTSDHPDAGTEARAAHEVDRFADALARALGHDVTVVDPAVADVPSDGIVVAFDAEVLRRSPAIAVRAILVWADRSKIQRLCEDLHLLGAIDQHRYFGWRTNPQHENGIGVYGRKDVAAAMGARVTGMYPSQVFGMLAVDGVPDLVSLLAAYITAVGEVGVAPRGGP